MNQCKKNKKLKEIKSENFCFRNNFMERISENLKKEKFCSTPKMILQFECTNQIFVDCIYCTCWLKLIVARFDPSGFLNEYFSRNWTV